MSTDRKLMSTPQAASYLGISKDTLRWLRSEGKGPVCYKPSGSEKGWVYYRQSDLDEWMEGQRVSKTNTRTDGMMSTTDVAVEFGLSSSSIRTMRARGKGPRFSVSKESGQMRIWYNRRDVQEWLDKGRY